MSSGSSDSGCNSSEEEIEKKLEKKRKRYQSKKNSRDIEKRLQKAKDDLRKRKIPSIGQYLKEYIEKTDSSEFLLEGEDIFSNGLISLTEHDTLLNVDRNANMEMRLEEDYTELVCDSTPVNDEIEQQLQYIKSYIDMINRKILGLKEEIDEMAEREISGKLQAMILKAANDHTEKILKAKHTKV
jgi:hypothetical protein